MLTSLGRYGRLTRQEQGGKGCGSNKHDVLLMIEVILFIETKSTICGIYIYPQEDQYIKKTSQLTSRLYNPPALNSAENRSCLASGEFSMASW